MISTLSVKTNIGDMQKFNFKIHGMYVIITVELCHTFTHTVSFTNTNTHTNAHTSCSHASTLPYTHSHTHPVTQTQTHSHTHSLHQRCPDSKQKVPRVPTTKGKYSYYLRQVASLMSGTRMGKVHFYFSTALWIFISLHDTLEDVVIHLSRI